MRQPPLLGPRVILPFTLGIGCIYRKMLSLSGFKSTHILTTPDFLGIITIPAHHGISWLTVEITPIAPINSSSSFTFSQRGRGTFLGVYRKGVALSLNFILYSSPSVPRPLNTFTNHCLMLSAALTKSTGLMRHNF